MRILFEAAVSNALVAGLLALVVAAICRFPIRPAVRHALWLMILVKLITPPLVRIDLPATPTWLNAWSARTAARKPPVRAVAADRGIVIQRNAAPPTAVALTEPAQLEECPPELDLMVELLPRDVPDGPAGSADLPADSMQTAVAAAPQNVSKIASELQDPAESTGEWFQAIALDTVVLVLGTVWIGGSFVWFFFAGYRLRTFHQQIDRLRPADGALQSLADEVAIGFGLTHRPEVRMTEAIVPPMLTLRPNRAMIILPTRFMESLSPAQQSAILAHELAHFRRGDQWMRWFEFTVVGLYWWHPAVWYARKELQAAEELCCDAWVVRVFPDHARGYAHALLTAVDFLAEVRTPAPAEACTLGPLSSLKQRLDMILKRKPFPELSPAAKVALVALAFIILPWAPEMFGQDAPATPALEAKPAAQELPPPVEPAAPVAERAPTLLPVAAPPAGIAPPTAPAALPAPTAAPDVPRALPARSELRSLPNAPRTVPSTPAPSLATEERPVPLRTTVNWPVAATYTEGGAATLPAGSVEERLDRLERMLEQFLKRAPVTQYGYTSPNSPVTPTIATHTTLTAPTVRRGNWTEDVLAATDRRIQELEQELSTLKRRKEALAHVDPNGVSVFVIPNDKVIRAINVTTGTTLWSFSIDNPESVQSARSDGQFVIVTTKEGNRFRLDAKTGRLILTLPPMTVDPSKPAAPVESKRQGF